VVPLLREPSLGSCLRGWTGLAGSSRTYRTLSLGIGIVTNASAGLARAAALERVAVTFIRLLRIFIVGVDLGVRISVISPRFYRDD